MKMKWLTSASSAMAMTAAALLLSGGSAAQAQDAVAKGKEVFEQCSVCHNADSDEKKMGPGLKGLYKKAKLKSGKPVNDATVGAIIKTGGNGMPAYEDMLSKDELTQLIAYLKTL
jgi:mono/diheme cytochrome c family protein